MQIKNININDFFTEHKKQKFVQDLGDSLADVGFFTVTGHGIDGKYLDNVYDKVKELFYQPEQYKKTFEKKELHGQRGYTSFGVEKAKDAKTSDLKEFWHIGREHDSIYTNIWPDKPHGFKDTIEDFYNKMDQVSFVLLSALSLYFKVEEDYFPSRVKGGESLLRLIHYPSISKEQLSTIKPGAVRAAAHEDINLITLLPAATSEGLQLLSNEGQWVDVECENNSIIVDSGDMIQNLTGGILRSTTHRVANPKDFSVPRFSMPFFIHPRGDVSLAPDGDLIKNLSHKNLNNKEKLIYRDITAREYLHERLKEIGLKG